MTFLKTFALILFTLNIASTLAVPVIETQGLNKRGSVLVYTLENNLWGESAATSGSQTSQVTATSGTTITWHTTYSWTGGNTQVKSYANLDLRQGLGKAISAISSIPTTWHWTYSSASTNLVADVSYDLWLSEMAGTGGASSSSTYEIMIWLSTRGGAGPAGSQIGTATVDGVTWKLYKGTVSTWTVFSFVAPSEITSFVTDLKPFLTYLTGNQGVPSSQFLVQAQAGTEPFIGSATLSTTSYSLAIN
ncbi:glycoside hydrolase family 12 protein [Heterobasidion irregulare TC 32-1]|uniref:Glycoside hydrolase family 12 protein n=1 Tax=Heterobasidion irregulare (strain TC 32-1) TaxID=747525 RepID=W4KH42_HETIT|nr:glycoside hydrolase family 12 protein [Heterobasidion irregulare TC 32-1]ETW85162.1 glycoside hydrolase family 12 protein [Heterobasidion irregulare TC 32-1]